MKNRLPGEPGNIRAFRGVFVIGGQRKTSILREESDIMKGNRLYRTRSVWERRMGCISQMIKRGALSGMAI